MDIDRAYKHERKMHVGKKVRVRCCVRGEEWEIKSTITAITHDSITVKTNICVGSSQGPADINSGATITVPKIHCANWNATNNCVLPLQKTAWEPKLDDGWE